jgi:hypothetical protein
MPELSAILANPAEFGFRFVTETVKRLKRTSGPVPLVVMENIPKFDAAFPGVIEKTENGQSIRVNSQRIVRDAWFDDQDHDTKSLQTRLVRWLLGIEQPGRVLTKYRVKIAGEWMEFDSQEEADAAEKELQVATIRDMGRVRPCPFFVVQAEE